MYGPPQGLPGKWVNGMRWGLPVPRAVAGMGSAVRMPLPHRLPGKQGPCGRRLWPGGGSGLPRSAGVPDPRPLQGLCVLLFHCVLNREVRKHLKGVLAGRKPHPDDSATTRATLLTVGGARGPRAGRGPAACSQGSVWGPAPCLHILPRGGASEPPLEHGLRPDRWLSSSQPAFQGLGGQGPAGQHPAQSGGWGASSDRSGDLATGAMPLAQ